jgi:hypothetical protein
MPNLAIAIVGIILSIVGILVTLFLRERKHLDYEFISGTRLLADEATRLAGELELRFKSSIIKDPYLLLVRLINTGNRPLGEEDFEQPIRIELDAPVLTGWIAKADPEELAPTVRWYADIVEVPGTLFNKGDWIALGVLTDGEPREKKINIRIVGVKKARQFEHYSKALNQAAVFLGILAGMFSFLASALLVDPLTHGDFTRWQDLANPPGLANPPWQYYAITVSALLLPIFLGIIVTRLVRRLSQRTTASMKVVL